MKIYDSVSQFCLDHGLNHTNQVVDNDDSCHDIKEFIVYGYERFTVSGFTFMLGEFDIPRPVARLGSYSVFNYDEAPDRRMIQETDVVEIL